MVETQIVSVERMREFATVDPEPPREVEGYRPPEGWPRAGAIEMRRAQPTGP